MELTTLKFERADGVATITLDRPDERNAISATMVAELKELCEHIEDEVEEPVVVIRGANGVFCGGIDLTDFPADKAPDIYGFGKWEKACRTVERLPKVTIAVVDGECAGGGFQLALTCDVRVATDRADFHLHEVRDGFLPGMGTFRLAKFVGLGRARRLALTGRHLDAGEAAAMGLIDHRCEAAAVDATLRAAIDEFGTINPIAVGLCRRLFDESFEMPYEEFIGSFLAAQHRAVQQPVFRRQVRAAHGLPPDPEDG